VLRVEIDANAGGNASCGRFLQCGIGLAGRGADESVGWTIRWARVQSSVMLLNSSGRASTPDN
jgi:hypothetical protein